jgi:hypothetical protein
MTQNDNELQIVDPVDAVRRLEGLFFRGGRFSPAESAAHLFQECLLRRATTISIRNVGDWWMIGADVDSLAQGAAAAFERVISYPEDGQTACASRWR